MADFKDYIPAGQDGDHQTGAGSQDSVLGPAVPPTPVTHKPAAPIKMVVALDDSEGLTTADEPKKGDNNGGNGSIRHAGGGQPGY
jgi:hypothetical protein